MVSVNKSMLVFVMGILLLAGCSAMGVNTISGTAEKESEASSKYPENPNLNLTFDDSKLKEIWLAGGCFWGVEAYMARIYGVADVTSGYANGNTENPTYEEVVYNNTGHAETVHVLYDPERVDLEKLLSYYFTIIDPTSVNKQGSDRGKQYRTGIYYKDEADKAIIEKVVAKEQKKYDDPIVTEVEPLRNFYLAEEYHQDYLEKNPDGYCHVSFDSLEDQDAPQLVDSDLYPKPSEKEIKKKLTDIQYKVTQGNDTELAFSNEYWDNEEPGLYVDVVTGELIEKLQESHGQQQLAILVDHVINSSANSKDEGYKVKIQQEIEANISNVEFSLQYLAGKMALTPTYLSSLFKRLFGIPFQEYMLSTRLDRAKILLLSTNMKIYEVAKAIGFEDPNYFSAAFKKRFHCSPNQFKDKARE